MPPRNYDDTNRLTLWEQEPEKPGDLTGNAKIEINGQIYEFWVTLWENGDGGGRRPVLSGSVKLKNQAGGGGRQQAEAPQRQRRYGGGGGGGAPRPSPRDQHASRYGSNGSGGRPGGSPREQDVGNDSFPDDEIPF